MLSVVLIAAVAPASPAVAADEYLPGIDVSHWQGRIRWANVKSDGVQFVVAKATEGRTFVDDQYARNRRLTRRHGLPFTAYHFARPDRTRNDALREANHFVRTADLRGYHLLPVLDLEVHGGLGRKALIRWTKQWLRRVEAHLGVKPMIYTSPSFWRERMGNTTWFAENGYELWIAHWHTDTPRMPAANWGSAGWTLWQTSDCGQVAGIDGCVDLDVYNGTDIDPLLIRNRR
jgi:lysozyme